MNIEVVCDNCGKTFVCKHKNRPENLQIMSKEAHTQYHMQLRKLASQNLVKSVKPKS